jgi:hypothetical protein
MMRAVGFIAFSSASPTSPRVPSVRVVWTEMKSDSFRS